jgi:protoheme IX farnesyltransferase
VMLRRNDIGGLLTATESMVYAVALAVVTMLPAVLKMTTALYLGGSVVFNAIMLLCAIQFLIRRDRMSARRLFFASILYLPCILGLLVFTRA